MSMMAANWKQTNRRMNEQTAVQSYNGRLLGNTKALTTNNATMWTERKNVTLGKRGQVGRMTTAWFYLREILEQADLPYSGRRRIDGSLGGAGVGGDHKGHKDVLGGSLKYYISCPWPYYPTRVRSCPICSTSWSVWRWLATGPSGMGKEDQYLLPRVYTSGQTETVP